MLIRKNNNRNPLDNFFFSFFILKSNKFNYDSFTSFISTQLINKNPVYQSLKLTNDAYIVVYSVTDKSSFQIAIDLIKTIRSNENDNNPIILVGNKSDLVRKKSITREGMLLLSFSFFYCFIVFYFLEGRNLALKYTCKFVETSVAINDKVDDLLVGILKQIRLNFGIDGELMKMSQNGNEGKMLHPIKEILKTFDENKNLKKSKKNKKHSRNHSTGYDYKNEILMTNKSEQQQKKSTLLKNYKFFSKRQYSDTENIYDIDSTTTTTTTTTGPTTNNNEQMKNNKKNLSFFHKLFTHIFKRKSNRMLLQSVEDLYTPVVKINCCLAKD